MRPNRNIFTAIVPIIAAAGVAGCGSGAQPIVRAGGEVITSAQLTHWMRVRSADREPTRDTGRAHLRDTVLMFLIRARWLEGWAGRDGVAAAQPEAAHDLALFEYARMRGAEAVKLDWQHELAPYLRSAKATAGDRLRLMTLSALHRRYVRWEQARAEGVVTRREVVAYYRRESRRFVVPEARDLTIVESYSRLHMLEARTELAAGVSPQSVARRFSEDPIARSGLLKGWVMGRGAPALDRAIFSAEPHIVVGPLQVAMYYVFEVRSIRRPRVRPLADVERRIIRALADGGTSHANDLGFSRALASRTTCRRGYVVAGCREYRGPAAVELQ